MQTIYHRISRDPQRFGWFHRRASQFGHLLLARWYLGPQGYSSRVFLSDALWLCAFPSREGRLVCCVQFQSTCFRDSTLSPEWIESCRSFVPTEIRTPDLQVARASRYQLYQVPGTIPVMPITCVGARSLFPKIQQQHQQNSRGT